MAEHVVVTGGAGYIGSILTHRLLAEGYRVTVVDSLRYGQQALFHLCAEPAFEFIRGDVRDEQLMRECVASADVLIPLAAIVGAPACEAEPFAAEAVNLDAVKQLNRLRSPRQLVVFPVTNSGYGTKSDAVYCTEETPLEPITLYGRTKVAAEAELLASENAITLRLATVFGMSPRMRFDLLVNHFVYTAVREGYLVVFEKDFKRNYIHIRDVADCFIHAIRQADRMAGRPFNVGLDSANCSKEELALKIKAAVPGLAVHFSDLRSDPDKRDYIVSNQRLREAGFEATRSLEQGIQELVKGCRMAPRGPFANA